MNTIAAQIERLHRELPPEVQLVAVSKYHPVESLRLAYEAGQRLFGESRVQELLVKQQELPTDIEWHFIGHLQTNKVKQIIPGVALIHSVDSQRLLQEIERVAALADCTVDCLLQIHIAQEESKFGFTPQEALQLFENEAGAGNYPHVHFRGVMGMATFTDNQAQVRQEFGALKACFDTLKSRHFAIEERFDTLSMGMSDDYPLALEMGSTLVRIGSTIFGGRA